MNREKLTSNAQAVRWCKSHNARTEFDDGICTISYQSFSRSGKTLLVAVNSLIDFLHERGRSLEENKNRNTARST